MYAPRKENTQKMFSNISTEYKASSPSALFQNKHLNFSIFFVCFSCTSSQTHPSFGCCRVKLSRWKSFSVGDSWSKNALLCFCPSLRQKLKRRQISWINWRKKQRRQRKCISPPVAVFNKLLNSSQNWELVCSAGFTLRMGILFLSRTFLRFWNIFFGKDDPVKRCTKLLCLSVFLTFKISEEN